MDRKQTLQDGLHPRRGLTKSEIASLRALADTCNAHDGLDLKFNWEALSERGGAQTSDFLCRRDGQWVGYLGLFQFHAREVEANGMVHPAYRRRGIMSSLWALARAECLDRGAERVLFICERVSKSGRAFLWRIGAQLASSEYKMMWDGHWPESAGVPEIHLRMATAADRPEVARQNAIYFGVPEEEQGEAITFLSDQAVRGSFIGEAKGAIIGKVDVSVRDGEGWIYGLGVLPEYRGRGYGKALLMETLRKLRRWNPARIYLEVNAANGPALSLYRSCGFVETTLYDYYEIRLQGW